MINTNQADGYFYEFPQDVPTTKVSKLNQCSLGNKTHHSDFFYPSNKKSSWSAISTPNNVGCTKKNRQKFRGTKKTESIRERKSKIHLGLYDFSKIFMNHREGSRENLQNENLVNSSVKKKAVSTKIKINENSKKSLKNSLKNIGHPARFVPNLMIKNNVKQKNKISYESNANDSDFSAKIIEDDKKYFENELMFRKLRKHKVVKKLHINYDEDSWEWSSYGSSPSRKVTFKE